MLTLIKHRGPDESGIYLSEKIALGSVRLSIIDLSQVLCLFLIRKNLCGLFLMVKYSIILNYEKSFQKGHIFTTSDTEVVVHLYEEWFRFLPKLNGQFAIAIWDKQKEELFLARDRVGIRPLFYTELNGEFCFCL